jgi:hypothetical protein
MNSNAVLPAVCAFCEHAEASNQAQRPHVCFAGGVECCGWVGGMLCYVVWCGVVWCVVGGRYVVVLCGVCGVVWVGGVLWCGWCGVVRRGAVQCGVVWVGAVAW